MPAWNELPSEELRGLTAFVGSLYNQKSEQKDSPLRVDEVARARGLFAANCVVCHGKEGAGDGISATNLAPAPSNFHRIEPTLGYAEGAIERGVPGTAMPTWRDKLKAEDRALLARYVRTLFQPIEKD